MRAYGKRMFEDPMDGVYPSRAIFGKKRLKALKRKLRSRKKEARQRSPALDELGKQDGEGGRRCPD